MKTRVMSATAAVERDGKFHAEYIPPPPPPEGKIVVRAPADSRGRAICPDLHLTPEQASDLYEALGAALADYTER